MRVLPLCNIPCVYQSEIKHKQVIRSFAALRAWIWRSCHCLIRLSNNATLYRVRSDACDLRVYMYVCAFHHCRLFPHSVPIPVSIISRSCRRLSAQGPASALALLESSRHLKHNDNISTPTPQGQQWSIGWASLLIDTPEVYVVQS